jgi:hypothetical protein
MADDLGADVDVSAPEPIPAHKAGGTGELSLAEAARSLADWRNKQAAASEGTNNKSQQQERAPAAPAAEQQSAVEADAAPPKPEAPGDTEEAEPTEPEDQSPIDPPRSWTKEAKERWQSLPRDTQTYLAEREQERDREVRRSQNEAADQLKGLQAREQAMEQARLQFEQATQYALQGLQQQLAGEFGDIKTMDDVKKLAAEDWPRYLRWDAHQKDIAAKMATVREAQQRQVQEHSDRFARFAQEQDKLFIERNPEFADPEKAAKMQTAAVTALRDVGFSEEELGQLWNGQLMLSLRDGRMQSLIADGVRYRQGQTAAKKVAANKTLPPVQRPGVAQSGHADTDDKIKSLQRQLDRATGMNAIRLATELQQLQREAASRR